MVEDFVDVAMMHNAEAAKVGHAMSEIARKFDDTSELGQRAGFRSISISKVGGDELIGLVYDTATNGFAGKGIRKMLEAVVDKVGGFYDGIVKDWHW